MSWHRGQGLSWSPIRQGKLSKRARVSQTEILLRNSPQPLPSSRKLFLTRPNPKKSSPHIVGGGGPIGTVGGRGQSLFSSRASLLIHGMESRAERDRERVIGREDGMRWLVRRV
ncbi:hypothetical protein JTE90_013288 [Oedothorax gibbosus]|uniref:Uncharacterized protein n=1 Tax=Oedothorax gibbosus TaxID=931172 RepID=A0AAV6VF44_9ARAC|nr:hypothetical protein JTE90_013288 [Oedothorax gibbosus]